MLETQKFWEEVMKMIDTNWNFMKMIIQVNHLYEFSMCFSLRNLSNNHINNFLYLRTCKVRKNAFSIMEHAMLSLCKFDEKHPPINFHRF